MANTAKSKSKTKRGAFGTSSKTVSQFDLRFDKLNEIQSKQKSELKKNESALLNASQALQATKRSTKSGMFSTKPMFSNTSQSNQSSSSFFDNLNLSIMQGDSINVKSLIDNKSPTGVLSQKDVFGSVNTFMDKIKGLSDVTSVQAKKDAAGKIIGVDVGKEYQKTTFDFDVNKLMLNNSGWKADIPEDFIKKSDTHYVAPTTTYTKEYYYKKSGDRKNKDVDYGSYNPVEIFLQDSGDKLSKVIKKGTYVTDYDEKERDDYRKETVSRDVFNTKIADYFGTGLLKQVQTWGTYTAYEEDERSSRDDRDQEYQDAVYLSSNTIYDEKGRLKDQKTYGTYEAEEDSERRSSYDRSEEIKEKSYLRTHNEYDDGLLSRSRTWDDYIKREEEDSFGGEEVERDIYLRDDVYYNKGNKTAAVRYDDVLTGFKSGKSVRRIGNDSSGRWYDMGSNAVLNWQNRNSTSPSTSEPFKTAKKTYAEKEYDITIGSLTYYDPLTGAIIQKQTW